MWNNVVVTPLEKAYSAADMEPYYEFDESDNAPQDNNKTADTTANVKTEVAS